MREAVQSIHRLPFDREILTYSREDLAILEAVQRYSTRSPLAALASLPVTDGRAQLSAIPGWGSDWEVREVYNSGYRVPPEAWSVYPGVDGPVLHVRGGEVQISYTKPHELTESLCTIPVVDFGAVAHLAASLILMQLANQYAQKKQASIDAVAVEFGRISGEYFLRARDENNLYESHMRERIRHRSASVNWNTRSRHGKGRMFQGPYQ